MTKSDLYLRLRALLFRDRVEQELDDELALHLEMETRKNLAAGMSPQEAARVARLHFGTDPGAVKDYVRDTRRLGFLETLGQDVRYALRGFRRAPLFALTVIGTIAIGLGWNTAAFTIFNSYLLRPIDARDPHSLYGFGWQDLRENRPPLTWSQLDRLRQEHPGFTSVTAIRSLRTRLEGRYAAATLVDGEFFHMLGVNAALGRALLPEDNQDSSPVLVLNYTTWQNRFSGAADVLGRKVLIQGHPFVVVGVMPEEFTGLGHSVSDFWAPLATLPEFEDTPNPFAPETPAPVILAGRLLPGQSMQQARSALTAWLQRVTQQAAPSQAPHADLTSLATLVPLNRRYLGAFFSIGIVFLLVLLSACANVANMMLARAMSRQREIGIRLSLGAARGRLIRQLLTESVLLAIPAAALAFAASQAFIGFGTQVVAATVPSAFLDQVRLPPLSPDVHVFWFMNGAALAVALLFGLAPAIQATRLDVMQAARGDFSSEFRPARMRNALVIAQITVCGFLLICSAVLLRRINHLESLDPGMRTRDILEIYVQPKSRPRAIAALQSRSDVDLLTASSDPPFDATLPRIPVSGASAAAQTVIRYRYVSPDYFQTLEIPVFRGRSFSADEGSSDSGVAVLSESAARKLWPNGDALGQRLNLTPPPSPVPGRRAPRYRTMEVVGIVRDSAVEALDNPDRSALFFPTTIDDSRNALLVRIHGDPEQALRALNAAIEQAEPGAILDIHTEQDYVAAGIWSYRVTYWISAALGCIALLLTISGIYGVLSYVVAQRAKEIGIRMAMGAGTRAVTSLVLAQCARLAAIGIAAGTGLALVAARILSAISAGIAPAVFDRVAYLGGIRSCSPPASPRPSSPPAEPLVSTPSPLFATIKTAPRNTYSPKGQS